MNEFRSHRWPDRTGQLSGMEPPQEKGTGICPSPSLLPPAHPGPKAPPLVVEPPRQGAKAPPPPPKGKGICPSPTHLQPWRPGPKAPPPSVVPAPRWMLPTIPPPDFIVPAPRWWMNLTFPEPLRVPWPPGTKTLTMPWPPPPPPPPSPPGDDLPPTWLEAQYVLPNPRPKAPPWHAVPYTMWLPPPPPPTRPPPELPEGYVPPDTDRYGSPLAPWLPAYGYPLPWPPAQQQFRSTPPRQWCRWHRWHGRWWQEHNTPHSG